MQPSTFMGQVEQTMLYSMLLNNSNLGTLSYQSLSVALQSALWWDTSYKGEKDSFLWWDTSYALPPQPSPTCVCKKFISHESRDLMYEITI